MLQPGLSLDNRYRLDEHIASGGMSDVWRGTDTLLGRTVAVKLLPPGLLSDPGFSTRFRIEARLMAALHHPGVADVYDYGESPLPGGGRAVYLVMEYVDGRPLSAMLAERERIEVPLVISIVVQAARALQAAHERGIVHRDVKPGNLLVKPDGSVVLVDFGVARSASTTSITGTNMVVGTALYMAPEQARGNPVSAATDVYALGAVAYHCLAGRPPFSGDSALQVAFRHLHDELPPLPADIPEPVRAVVHRALAKDPAERFPSAAALAAAVLAAGSMLGTYRFAALAAGTAAGAPGSYAPLALRSGYLAGFEEPDGVPMETTVRDVEGFEEEPPPRRLGRWAALAGVAAALLMALIGLAGVLPSGKPQARPPTQPTRSPTTPATTRASENTVASYARVPVSPSPVTRTTTAKPTPAPSRTASPAPASAPPLQTPSHLPPSQTLVPSSSPSTGAVP